MTATRGPSHPGTLPPATVGDMSRYRNTTNAPLVFDTAGHQVDAFGTAEVDAHDPRSARHIHARRLVLVPDPVQFLEPSAPEEPPEEAPTEPEADTEAEDTDAAPEPEPTKRTTRTRTSKKESEQ